MTTAVAPTRAAVRVPVKRKRPGRGRNAALGLLAWIIGIVFVVPVLWMFLTSFHSEANAGTNPPKLDAPLTLAGYRDFFGSGGGTSPWPYLANSVTASVVSTLLVLLLAIPAAYALSIRP